MKKKAHIILTAPNLKHSVGKLNLSLALVTKDYLKEQGYEVTQTEVHKEQYDVEEETKRYQDSSLIAYQFPMWWFQIPHFLKRYIDNVMTSDAFFGPSEGIHYGTKGQLVGKQYFISVTMNAPDLIFNNGGDYFAGNMTPDELFNGFHCTQRYIGMKRGKSIFHHNVVHGDTTNILKDHLDKLKKIEVI